MSSMMQMLWLCNQVLSGFPSYSYQPDFERRVNDHKKTSCILSSKRIWIASLAWYRTSKSKGAIQQLPHLIENWRIAKSFGTKVGYGLVGIGHEFWCMRLSVRVVLVDLNLMKWRFRDIFVLVLCLPNPSADTVSDTIVQMPFKNVRL